MQVVVVGASGFLGRSLVRHLLEAGHSVIGCGRSSERPASLSEGAAWHPIGSSPTSFSWLGSCDGLFYLAQSAEYRRIAERFDDVLEVNVVLAARAAIAAAAAGCRFFCYASTGNVYAPSFAPHREDDVLERGQGYALSKVVAEECLPMVTGSMKFAAARFFGLYGAGQTGMLVSNIIERVRSGTAVGLQPGPDGDVDGLRVSLCHVDDASRILVRLAKKAHADDPLPRALNVAGPAPISIRMLADEAGKQFGKTPTYSVADAPRKFDLVADIGLLRSLMPLEFATLSEGLQSTIASLG